MSAHIVVVVNGTFPHTARLASLARRAALLIAADGGANWLDEQGLTPHVLIGDLDSVHPAVLASLEASACAILRYAPAKDETDTELALRYAVQQAPARITLIGALGGRIDHELANIMLLALPALGDIPTAIYDGATWVRLLAAGQLALQGTAGDTVSLLPLGGDCHGVTTVNMAYPLNDETLFFGPARGISNIMLGPTAQVLVRAGRLLVVHTPIEEPVEQGGNQP